VKEIFEDDLNLAKDDLSSIFRYNNTSKHVSTKRNQTSTDASFLKQRTLLELEDLSILSKLKVEDMKINQLSIYMGEFREGNYKKVAWSLKSAGGKLREIDLGSLPCKFVLIEVEKGAILPQLSKLSFYGIKHS